MDPHSYAIIANEQSTTRSPLFISFSEALVGMSTIRSYGDSARFMRKIFRELDQNTRCFWYLWQTNRVLHNFSNFTGSLVTIFACVFALRNKEMSAGAVGFSISYAREFDLFSSPSTFLLSFSFLFPYSSAFPEGTGSRANI